MASERKEQTQPIQQIFVPMTCALMAWQLQSSTLTTLASKPTSRDRLLGAGHHDWKLKSNNIVLALPLLGGSRTSCFFLTLGLAHRLHGS